MPLKLSVFKIPGALILLLASSQCFARSAERLPLSDPQNQGGWIYNSEVSDEFDSSEIDEGRWYIVGKFENGKPVYKHPDKPEKKFGQGEHLRSSPDATIVCKTGN